MVSPIFRQYSGGLSVLSQKKSVNKRRYGNNVKNSTLYERAPKCRLSLDPTRNSVIIQGGLLRTEFQLTNLCINIGGEGSFGSLSATRRLSTDSRTPVPPAKGALIQQVGKFVNIAIHTLNCQSWWFIQYNNVIVLMNNPRFNFLLFLLRNVLL